MTAEGLRGGYAIWLKASVSISVLSHEIETNDNCMAPVTSTGSHGVA